MGKIIECSLVADSDFLDDIIEFIGHVGAEGDKALFRVSASKILAGQYLRSGMS